MKSSIEKRLTRQLVGKHEKAAAGTAHGLLVKDGIIKPSGELTAKGSVRNDMTPAQLAKDRSAKASGHDTGEFKYDKKTNRATLKK